MSVIATQNFDGVTAPAIPSGWHVDAPYTTTTTGSVSPHSSPNMLDMASTGPGVFFATYGTQDGNSGDIVVKAFVAISSVAGSPPSAGVTARVSSSTPTSSGSSLYMGWINVGGGTFGITVQNGASTTTLASNSGATFSASSWYIVALTCSGSSLSLTVQRVSDSFWLTSAGTFQSGTANAATATDSSITGQGYSGVFVEPGSRNSFNAYFDDWELDTAATPSSSATMAKTEAHDTQSASGVNAFAATIAKTEAHDTASASGSQFSVASLARTESHDTASASGYSEHATLAATDGRDSASMSGTSARAATIGRSDGRDISTMTALVQAAILTRQDGADTPAIAAKFAAVATMAGADGKDIHALFGVAKSAKLSPTERHDKAAISAIFASVATMAVAERHDAATLAATAHNAITLAGIESHDAATLSGAIAASARIAVAEGRDRGSLSTTTLVTASLAATEGRDRSSTRAVAQGVPPAFKVQEAGDVAGLFGSVSDVQYDIYVNDGLGGLVNYAQPIAVTGATTWMSGTLHPGTWTFAVRAENPAGIEQNVDVVVTFTIDAYGNDVTNMPSAPTGLRAFATAGGGIRVEWWYPAIAGKTPTGFYVYAGTGGTPNYGSPAATVPYANGLFNTFVANLSGLANGQQYAIGVRSYNASGIDQNTNFVLCTADSVGPSAVSSLTAVAIV